MNKANKKTQRRLFLDKQEAELLGNKSIIHTLINALDAVNDAIVGIKNAANISNESLSNKAKNALEQLQEFSNLEAQRKILKQQLDADLAAIDSETE